MSGLAIAQAPPPARPLRFLLTAAAWGVVAGAWLLWQGDAAMTSRWAPATIVLVHLFTLGVLGNAMLGSLLQFLPVAAGSPLGFGSFALRLHATFNAGLLLFVPGLMLAHPLALSAASLLLAGSLTAFAVMALSGLARGSGLRLLRLGIATAVSMLVPTAALGTALIAIVLGKISAPLDRVADLHAALGTLGWTLMLIASVGSVTVPMFQGTPAVSHRALAWWITIALAGLAAGGIGRWNGSTMALSLGIAVPALLFVGASLWLQIHARHRRNPALTVFWALGILALGAACLVLLAAPGIAGPGRADPGSAILAGTLAIGIGLPFVLIGMMLEIVGFLAWIGLRRECERGVRIPSVDRLMPEKDKWIALLAHGASAMALVYGALHPARASFAGLMLLIAFATTLYCMLRCLARARGFQRSVRRAHAPTA